MKKITQHLILLAVVFAYTSAVFIGHYNATRKVLYSTPGGNSVATNESKPKPFDARPLWTYKSQIVSSCKILVPVEALITTIDFPIVREFIVVEPSILLPGNLQPLSFPSKPRDPPSA